MKNAIRFMVIGLVCALSMHSVSAMVTIISPDGRYVLSGTSWVPFKEKTSSELFKDATKKWVCEVASVAKPAIAVAVTAPLVWASARQFQIAREHGVGALWSHKHSWPQYFKDVVSNLCSYLWQTVPVPCYNAAKNGVKHVAAAARNNAQSVYANYHNTCVVAGTAATVLAVAYAAKCAAKLLPGQKRQEQYS